MTKKILTLISLLIVVLLLALPTILESVVVNQIRKQGIDAAGIYNIDVNYFSGEVLVEGLTAVDEKALKFSLKQLYLDLEWTKLVKGSVAVDLFKVDGLYVDVKQLNKGLIIAGISPRF